MAADLQAQQKQVADDLKKKADAPAARDAPAGAKEGGK